MTQYNGTVHVDTSSWEKFKAETLGNGYNVDGVFGNQCVDYMKLLSYNLGIVYPYVKTGSLGYAYEIWTDPVSRAFNKGDEYDLITSIAELKVGDMVILGASSALGEYGHNGILDSKPVVNPVGTTGVFAYLVGQNQVDPNPTTGHPVTRTYIRLDSFLGAFRVKKWQTTPTPTLSAKAQHFPWYMVTHKKQLKLQRKKYMV